MGTDKNIKLHIVTDIKKIVNNVETTLMGLHSHHCFLHAFARLENNRILQQPSVHQEPYAR